MTDYTSLLGGSSSPPPKPPKERGGGYFGDIFAVPSKVPPESADLEGADESSAPKPPKLEPEPSPSKPPELPAFEDASAEKLEAGPSKPPDDGAGPATAGPAMPPPPKPTPPVPSRTARPKPSGAERAKRIADTFNELNEHRQRVALNFSAPYLTGAASSEIPEDASGPGKPSRTAAGAGPASSKRASVRFDGEPPRSTLDGRTRGGKGKERASTVSWSEDVPIDGADFLEDEMMRNGPPSIGTFDPDAQATSDAYNTYPSDGAGTSGAGQKDLLSGFYADMNQRLEEFARKSANVNSRSRSSGAMPDVDMPPPPRPPARASKPPKFSIRNLFGSRQNVGSVAGGSHAESEIASRLPQAGRGWTGMAVPDETNADVENPESVIEDLLFRARMLSDSLLNKGQRPPPSFFQAETVGQAQARLDHIRNLLSMGGAYRVVHRIFDSTAWGMEEVATKPSFRAGVKSSLGYEMPDVSGLNQLLTIPETASEVDAALMEIAIVTNLGRIGPYKRLLLAILAAAQQAASINSQGKSVDEIVGIATEEHLRAQDGRKRA